MENDWLSKLDRFVAFDLETHLIEPGILAPPVVCGSTAATGGAGEIVHPRAAVLDRARVLLKGNAVLVGANIAFDFGCLVAADPDLLPPVFRAYADGRVFDVQIAQALHAIADGNLGQDPRTGGPTCDPLTGKQSGRYSLAICVDLVLGRVNAKANDEWRLRYAELEDVPFAEWPQTAKQYPVDDAVNTLEVALAQVRGGGAGVTPGPHRNLGDLSNQVETAWALHLGAMWGLRTDPDRVEELRASTEKAHAAFVERFERLGFYRREGDEHKKDLNAIKRAVIRAYGGGDACPAPGCVGGRVLSQKTGNPIKCPDCSGTGLNPGAAPRTPSGGVCADRDALVESGDPDLAAFGDNEPEKVRETYLPFLESGTRRPISLRPNVLVASGRTSYDGLIQLMPRHGGVRDCFRARPGYVYCSVDYSAGELCTFSQVCLWILGRSHMADTINATGSPGGLHTAFAATLIGRTAEEMTALVKSGDGEAKDIRTLAKFCNFALLGGMGAAKFCLLARKKSSGTTKCADGSEVPGIRFCVLLEGAARCGERRVTEFKNRPIPPTCVECLRIADERLRPLWFEQWDEVPAYFSWVTGRVDSGGEFPCFGTERVRGGLDFTNGANNGFQALLADAAKHALRRVVREAYLDVDSPMYGARPIFFAHDEIVAELPEETAHLAGPRMADVMVEAARDYVPDVCIVAEPALMRTWNKAAATVYLGGDGKFYEHPGDGRRLVPWEMQEEAKRAASTGAAA